MAGLGGSGRARRTHRTEVNRERILLALRGGNTREDAARYAGMSAETLRLWIRADQGLLRDVEEAESTARMRAVGVVIADAFGQPAQYDDANRLIRAEVKANVSSAMWYLERRDPLNWGRRVTVDVGALVARLAADNGFDPDEVMAEVERLHREHAQTFRRGS